MLIDNEYKSMMNELMKSKNKCLKELDSMTQEMINNNNNDLKQLNQSEKYILQVKNECDNSVYNPDLNVNSETRKTRLRKLENMLNNDKTGQVFNQIKMLDVFDARMNLK